MVHARSKALVGSAVIAALTALMPAGAQGRDTGPQAREPGVITTSADHTKAMDRLTQAAQRLRETIQTLAAAPAGAQRNAAMESARAALWDAQQAMIELPPELRVRSGPMSEAAYAEAMGELKQAAQRLRDAAQAMAQQPAGERRNAAIEQANEAILEANQAMVQLPWEPGAKGTRTGATPGAAAGGTTGAARGPWSFERLDSNGDGSISRSEFSQHRQAQQATTAR